MKKRLLILTLMCISAIINAQTYTPWKTQNSKLPADREIWNICPVSKTTVWASASSIADQTPSNFFTKTLDGGNTWVSGRINGAQTYSFGNLWATSANNAFAAMFKTSGNGGAMFKTSDGGISWTIVSGIYTKTATNNSSFPNFVYFFDNLNGLTMGDPTSTVLGGQKWFELFKTEDGGASWSRVDSANIPLPILDEYGYVNIYDAVGDTIWFGTNKGRIYKSTNKGSNWTAHTTGLNDMSELAFRNGSVGLASYSNTDLVRTTDGGLTWNSISLTPDQYYFIGDIEYIGGDSARWINVGGRSAIGAIEWGTSFSKDDGQTWSLYNGNIWNVDNDTTHFTSLAFFDDTTGWAGGQSYYKPTAGGNDTVAGMAEFERSILVIADPVHTIAASKAGNGTISPSGTSYVNHGESITYTFTPNAGNHISELLVDGINVTPATSYTFSNVEESHTIKVIFRIGAGINDKKFGEIALFPNPANNLINLRIPGSNNTADIKITNILGKIVKSEVVQKQGDLFRVETTSIHPGVYFIEIRNNNQTKTVKFVKE